MAGDCESFIQKIEPQYRAGWNERCVDERTMNNTRPIRDFRIIEMSINNNRAFLLVELTRDSDSKNSQSNNYVVNYEMIRRGGVWTLNQEIKAQ